MYLFLTCWIKCQHSIGDEEGGRTAWYRFDSADGKWPSGVFTIQLCVLNDSAAAMSVGPGDAPGAGAVPALRQRAHWYISAGRKEKRSSSPSSDLGNSFVTSHHPQTLIKWHYPERLVSSRYKYKQLIKITNPSQRETLIMSDRDTDSPDIPNKETRKRGRRRDLRREDEEKQQGTGCISNTKEFSKLATGVNKIYQSLLFGPLEMSVRIESPLWLSGGRRCEGTDRGDNKGNVRISYVREDVASHIRDVQSACSALLFQLGNEKIIGCFEEFQRATRNGLGPHLEAASHRASDPCQGDQQPWNACKCVSWASSRGALPSQSAALGDGRVQVPCVGKQAHLRKHGERREAEFCSLPVVASPDYGKRARSGLFPKGYADRGNQAEALERRSSRGDGSCPASLRGRQALKLPLIILSCAVYFQVTSYD
ncbi:hypothetical protein MC885_016092, partial [Smutsia gigantea]